MSIPKCKPVGAVLACALLTTALSVNSLPRMPENEFACQVRDADGDSGLVLVQADNEERARIVASESRQWGLGVPEAALLTVVECVPKNGGTFKDRAFQASLRAVVM